MPITIAPPAILDLLFNNTLKAFTTHIKNVKLASDILIKEHKLIEELLNCMNKAVEDWERGILFETLPLKQYYEFAIDFVDLVHFQKEEQIWFKYLERNSPPDGSGPVAILASEHIWARRYISNRTP